MHGETPLYQTLILEERKENFRILQGYANENNHDTDRSDGDSAQIEQKLRRTTENNTKASIYLFISSFICNENSRPLSRLGKSTTVYESFKTSAVITSRYEADNGVGCTVGSKYIRGDMKVFVKTTRHIPGTGPVILAN